MAEDKAFGSIAAIIVGLIIMFIILGFVIGTIIDKFGSADKINDEFAVCEANGITFKSNMAQLNSLLNSDVEEAAKLYNSLSDCYTPDDLSLNGQQKAKLICHESIKVNAEVENFRAFNCK